MKIKSVSKEELETMSFDDIAYVILKEKGKSKYWLYIQLGLSYQNFNNLVSNRTSGIKFENLKALCDILECTPNDLFEEYYEK